MAEDFDGFERYLRQFQPRQPTRPLLVRRSPVNEARVRLVAAAVLLAALAAALVWLARATAVVSMQKAAPRIAGESCLPGSSMTAARLTRTVLASSRDTEDALATAAREALLRVERAEGPLHVLSKD